jgi:hypothetical protein
VTPHAAYLACFETLQRERDAAPLTDAQEAVFAAELDALWYVLTPEEQAQVEALLTAATPLV